MGMFGDVGGVPAVFSTGGDHKEGWGGGSWIFALVIIFFALVFFRGGFGGERGHDGGVGGGAVAAGAFNELNGRFNVLEGQIAHVSDLAELRHIEQQNCETNQNVTQQAYGLSRQIETNRFDTLLGQKNLSAELAACCCQTQRGIDALKYEGAKNTCEIIAANAKNTQTIVDVIRQNEIQTLRDKIAEQGLALSQVTQNAYLVNQLKPCPIPAYVTCNPNQSVPYAPVAPFAAPFGFEGRRDGCCGGGFAV